MFGFGKKKKDKTVKKAFERKYQNEDKELLVLTSDMPTGTGRVRNEGFWTANKRFLAYVDVNTNELYKGDGRIVQPLTDKEVKAKTASIYRLKGSVIYRLKVRELIDKTVSTGSVASFCNQFLLVKILEKTAANDKLSAVLDEYRRPVKFTDEVMGEFELNKDSKFFCGEISWLGEAVSVSLYVDADDEESCEGARKVLRALFDNQKQKDLEFKEFAAKELVELANDGQEEEEVQISEENFIKRMSITGLSVSSEGNFTIYYGDDDMFGGHFITVYGNIEKGLNTANIEG